jgi:putative oxidoreductase
MTEAAQEPDASQVPQPAPETPLGVKFKDSRRDWAIRIVIFLVFLLFASGKFKDDPGAPWVVLFQQIGIGQWFRYLTGVLEVLGAFLVLFSRTVELGLAVLAAVMFGAMVIVVATLHHLGDAFFPFAFLCGILAFWLRRRRADSENQIKANRVSAI